MFENQQKDVEVLIKSDSEFRSLYQRHQELDSKVRDAELGVLPMDDTTLHIPVTEASVGHLDLSGQYLTFGIVSQF